MTTTFTVRKMTLRDATKEHFEKKLAKLERFFGEDARGFVTLSLERNRVTAEITIRDRSLIYRAEAQNPDCSDAFDEAFDNVIRQIRKQKTRLEKRLRSTAFEEMSNEPVEEDSDYQVLRIKKFPIKPMDTEEAILQMNLLNHQFYVFRSVETNQIEVVYRRKDGNYGLIVPEEE